MSGPVTLVAVPQPLRPVLPTSSVGATNQRAIRVNELMIWISLPVRRFTATRDDHARAVWRSSRFRFDGGGQVHQRGDRTKHALSVIDQTDQLAKTCLPAQINHTVQFRMMISMAADLDESNFAAEMIHHLLIPFRLPPFERHIVFSAVGHHPEGRVLPRDFV